MSDTQIDSLKETEEEHRTVMVSCVTKWAKKI